MRPKKNHAYNIKNDEEESLAAHALLSAPWCTTPLIRQLQLEFINLAIARLWTPRGLFQFRSRQRQIPDPSITDPEPTAPMNWRDRSEGVGCRDRRTPPYLPAPYYTPDPSALGSRSYYE